MKLSFEITGWDAHRKQDGIQQVRFTEYAPNLQRGHIDELPGVNDG